MTPSPDYTPPKTGATLLRRQDELDALRLLIAQKRMYSRAKRWLSIRWFGMLVISLAAPVVAIIWPQSAIVVASIASLWLFAGRTFLMSRQNENTENGAATQEQFDFYVYEMPEGTPRPKLPSLEDISSKAGSDSEILEIATRENLLAWYRVSPKDSGTVAVAIAQRSNASYSGRLLQTTWRIWALVAALWTVFLAIFCVSAGLSLLTFLLGVTLPLLPAFLDVTEYIVGIRQSTRDRESLYREIESKIGNDEDPVTAENLRVWQESLYDIRRDTPTVPDFVYRLKREKNEAAMSSAAEQLSKRARKEEE